MNNKKNEIPVEVSARHMHLSKDDCMALFGKDVLENFKDVSQPNQYASVETVDIKGPKRTIKNVRIIAPIREVTQVEIAITDAYTLGIESPSVKASGDLEGSSGGIEIIGPKGSIELKKGLIVAQRHLHIEPDMAEKFGISHGDKVSIAIDGPRSLIFKNVLVRSRDRKDKLSFQIDTDEANAAGVGKDAKGYIVNE